MAFTSKKWALLRGSSRKLEEGLATLSGHGNAGITVGAGDPGVLVMKRCNSTSPHPGLGLQFPWLGPIERRIPGSGLESREGGTRGKKCWSSSDLLVMNEGIGSLLVTAGGRGEGWGGGRALATSK